MAAFDTTRSLSTSAPVGAVFSKAFASTFGALSAWNDARATRKALSALTARELEDIGLCYGDIESVVYR
ncbi:DUF1127 domain-containing protein [Thalassobium sp. R2A62]|jgi:uncharacterized protein YjiS (DUF1127 family)|uniref:DUF1127 domain-containing protein n=1 Tax=Thalassobium sp. R2A62 TaxID=633131 RepID=UPI0001B1CBBF|nr:DUF1127 domain-containing protein [Thalassobium sp. R2A62]EET46429.1 conserved domain protein [Thalassobium sp. R2A62]MDG1340604.1 DUF1127 domain-containing protein [Paracoccaceae bacterium]MDG2453222.1 DUF1127 domain-containing protein [Paracoccaceae bacterium]